MMMRLLTAVILSLLANIIQVHSACPNTFAELQVAVNGCTAPIGTIDYYADEFLGFCNNTAKGVSDCITNLLRDCRAASENAANALQTIVDVENLVSSVEYVCNNTAVIAANKVCIDQQRNNSRGCVESKFQEYSVQLSLLLGQLLQKGGAWYQSAVRKAACGYTRTLGGCAQTYLPNCNADVHSVYKSFFTSISLPNCEAILGQAGPTTAEPSDGCPRNAAQTVIETNKCIAPFRPLSSIREGFPSLDHLLVFCNSSEADLTSCLNHLETCAVTYPEIQDTLHGILNVAALTSFNSLTCQDVSMLKNARACAQPLKSSVDDCAVAEYRQYGREVAAAQVEARTQGQTWFKQKVLRLGCAYLQNVKKCLQPYEVSCGAALSEMYKKLPDAIASPACANLPPEPTTTTITTTTTEASIFGVDSGGFGTP